MTVPVCRGVGGSHCPGVYTRGVTKGLPIHGRDALRTGFNFPKLDPAKEN